MASILKHLRSSTADKRPTASGLADGQIALNTASGTPAMFFKDSAGNIVKVGPAHIGTTAPNVSPAGSAGNSDGELWIDESLTTRGLKYYDGTAFINLTPSGTTSTVGLVELATDAETQAGTDNVRVVTPSGLQSKISDSTSTTSSTTIASSTAVKSAFDLANAALPKTGGTLTGELLISPSGSLVFEGSSDDSFETTIAVTNPTADRTITFPNVTGNVVTTGDSGTVTSTMILDDTIVNADINSAAAIAHSKLANITAGSVLLGNASNVPTATALSGDVTINSSGVTAISAGVIVNADINASAAIVDTKLDTISTADKVSLSALNIDGATDIGGALENGDLFVVDDGAGGTNRKAQAFRMAQLTYSGVTGDITVASGGTAAISAGVIVNADVNASAAIVGTKISPDFGSQTVQTTGIFSHALGTAGAPTVTFTGDTNTGIYSPGADQVAISTSGTGRLFVDASGKILVNQSSQLSNATGQVVETNGNIVINSTTTGAGQAASLDFYHLVSTSTATRAGSKIDSFAEGSYTAGSATTSDSGLRFYTSENGTSLERLRITSAGLVGVGTSSPSKLLTIGTSSTANTTVRLNCSQTAGSDTGMYSFGIDDSTDFAGMRLDFTDRTSKGLQIFTAPGFGYPISFSGSSGNQDVTIDASGRVGIGTTSPLNKLVIASSGVGYEIDQSSIGNTNLLLSYDRGASAYRAVANYYGGTYSWNDSGNERARIDSSGRLLVGTSSARSNFFNSSSFSPALQLEGTNDQGRLLSVIGSNTGGAGGVLVLASQKSGTVGGNTIVTDGGQLGLVSFQGSDGTEFVEAARIQVEVDGTPGANDMPGRLVFSTTADGASSPTERMRINSSGGITGNANFANDYSFTTNNDGNNSDRYGLRVRCGTYAATGTNYAVSIEDGNGDNQGYITFTGGTVTYGAFTAHHPCILPEADNEAGYPYGTLLEIINIEYTQKDGKDTERGILYNVRKTQTANSRAVLGAYGSSMNGGPSGETNRHQALVLGDGHILCNNSGGNIKVGDGICSSATPGIGQKATATPSMIIGIAQEDVTFADDDEVKLVAVQYGVRQFIPWGD